MTKQGKHTQATFMGILVALAVFGCTEESTAPVSKSLQLPEQRSQRNEELAAEVDGVPVSLNDVKRLLAETDAGLSVEDAVDALIRNELLAAEARRRGYEENPMARDARHLALARAILNGRIGEGIAPGNIEEARLQEYYEEQKDRFVHGAKRKVVHFLAVVGPKALSDGEARTVAKEAYTKAKQVRSDTEFKKALEPLTSLHGDKVKLEELPPFEATSKHLVKPFVDATFAIPGVSGVSPPVKTQFGWHVIFVAKEIPAINKTHLGVKDQLLEEIVPIDRKRATLQLMKDLSDKTSIFIYDGALTTGETDP